MANRLDLLRRIMMGLCVVGILLAGYLTYTGFTNTAIYCVGGSTGCDTVQQSRYSKITLTLPADNANLEVEIPVALIGVLGYITILAVLILEETKRPLFDNGPLLTFGLTLFGVLYSGYLTYVEATIIRAYCQYCVASAITMVILFGSSAYRLYLKESLDRST